MNCVVDLIEELKSRYGGLIPFRQICADEGIIAAKAPMEDGVHGIYITSNGHRVILLNAKIKHSERRDRAFHELGHHFRSVSDGRPQYHRDRRDERRAELFAALCRIPGVRDGDDVQDLVDRYSVSPALARLRLEYEQRRI